MSNPELHRYGGHASLRSGGDAVTALRGMLSHS
jgi:hypothetical protein